MALPLKASVPTTASAKPGSKDGLLAIFLIADCPSNSWLGGFFGT
jgi:hypothetical protein